MRCYKVLGIATIRYLVSGIILIPFCCVIMLKDARVVIAARYQSTEVFIRIMLGHTIAGFELKMF